MPEDSRKHQPRKNKNEPKEQRKRQTRHQAPPIEKKDEKKPEEPKVSAPEKPVYQEPPPEFFKNLKRETDEILKITEEANEKYKKKEIQSNWSKYEMPIESYEEMQEQENMGADYEKLIQAPLSIGGHFQFKHEKSWDVTVSPSLYDKYFEINMDNLATALCTVPFYERNAIDKSIFNDTDMLSMKNRSTRYKQKYYNDKSYTTPELDAQDKILNNLKNSLNKPDGNTDNKNTEIEVKYTLENKSILQRVPECSAIEPIKSTQEITIDDFTEATKTVTTDYVVNTQVSKEELEIDTLKETANKLESPVIDDIVIPETMSNKRNNSNNKEFSNNNAINDTPVFEKQEPRIEVEKTVKNTTNPVIESPEDLEKWLDDFLDD